jgi:hypothetical protein
MLRSHQSGLVRGVLWVWVKLRDCLVWTADNWRANRTHQIGDPHRLIESSVTNIDVDIESPTVSQLWSSLASTYRFKDASTGLNTCGKAWTVVRRITSQVIRGLETDKPLLGRLGKKEIKKCWEYMSESDQYQ